MRPALTRVEAARYQAVLELRQAFVLSPSLLQRWFTRCAQPSSTNLAERVDPLIPTWRGSSKPISKALRGRAGEFESQAAAAAARVSDTHTRDYGLATRHGDARGLISKAANKRVPLPVASLHSPARSSSSGGGNGWIWLHSPAQLRSRRWRALQYFSLASATAAHTTARFDENEGFEVGLKHCRVHVNKLDYGRLKQLYSFAERAREMEQTRPGTAVKAKGKKGEGKRMPSPQQLRRGGSGWEGDEAFHDHLFCMLTRYSSLSGALPLPKPPGAKVVGSDCDDGEGEVDGNEWDAEAAVHGEVFDALLNHLDCRMELFASPINARSWHGTHPTSTLIRFAAPHLRH